MKLYFDEKGGKEVLNSKAFALLLAILGKVFLMFMTVLLQLHISYDSFTANWNNTSTIAPKQQN